jgi:Mn2+/Fe2+ NRAMP family transporter
VYELAAVKPVWLDVAKGFIPRPEIITNPDMLYAAIGILGEIIPCLSTPSRPLFTSSSEGS